MTIKKYFALFFLVLLPLSLFSQVAKKGAIHALVVVDTTADGIADSVKNDLKHMTAELGTVSSQTPLSLDIKTITGPKVTHANISQALHSMQSTSKDVIFFYFSGHGFRYKQETSPWPHIYLTTNDDDMAGVEITNILKSKKSALTVVLFDCCNSYAKGQPTLSSLLSGKKLPGLTVLFFNTTGLVVATASQPGQSAMGFAQGGLFTNSLLKAINNGAVKSSITWSSVLSQTVKGCAPLQKPVFYIKTFPKKK